MINNILAVGDSFTYGEELDDLHLAYPYIVGNKTGASVVNRGQPGSGNRKMVRIILEELTNPDNNYDCVLIGWASAGRMEFADADGIFDIWPGYRGNMFTRDQQLWRLDLLDYINEHHDPAYLYQQHLMDVILTQEFLKKRGIKYIMMTTSANEYYHKSHWKKFNHLADLVDSKHYIGWPNAGMTEWTHGCKKGPNGHFLDKGHWRVADEIVTNMEHLGWV